MSAIKDENGDYVANSQNILNPLRNYFDSLLNVKEADYNQETHLYSFIAEPSISEVGNSTDKLKITRLPQQTAYLQN